MNQSDSASNQSDVEAALSIKTGLSRSPAGYYTVRSWLSTHCEESPHPTSVASLWESYTQSGWRTKLRVLSRRAWGEGMAELGRMPRKTMGRMVVDGIQLRAVGSGAPRDLARSVGHVPMDEGVACASCEQVPPRSVCLPVGLQDGRAVALCSSCRYILRPGVKAWRIVRLGALLAGGMEDGELTLNLTANDPTNGG